MTTTEMFMLEPALASVVKKAKAVERIIGSKDAAYVKAKELSDGFVGHYARNPLLQNSYAYELFI